MVVDVRDPRTGGPALATNAQVGRVDAAVREAHAVVAAHGGRTVALLGTRLVGTFPEGSIVAGLDAAVDLQQRSAAPAASWACSIGLATGPDNHQVDSASLGIALVGGAVDRALLLASWSAAGSVVADDRTIASAQRSDPGAVGAIDLADPADPAGPGAPGDADGAGAGQRRESTAPLGADGASRGVRGVRPEVSRWSLGPSHVLVGHEREPVEYWELQFPRPGDEPTVGAPRFEPSAGAPTAGPSPAAPPTRLDVRARLDALDPTRPVGSSRPGGRPAARAEGPAEARAPRVWSRGEVRCWFPSRGRGVIGSATTQEFYVDRRFLAVPSTIDSGDRVFFVPRDAIGGGRNPAASAVLVVGAEVEVRVDEIDERGFGVSLLKDPAGTRARLVLDLRGSNGPVAAEPGDWLLVRIRASEHGPVGEPL